MLRNPAVEAAYAERFRSQNRLAGQDLHAIISRCITLALPSTLTQQLTEHCVTSPNILIHQVTDYSCLQVPSISSSTSSFSDDVCGCGWAQVCSLK